MPADISPARSGFPGTNVACFCCAFRETAIWITEAAEQCALKKYAVLPVVTATVDNLMNLPDCTIFGLDAHGYIMDGDNRPIPCIYTADEFTPANQAKYAALFATNPPLLVKYHLEKGDTIEHIGITAEFIKKYWQMKFADNGFVYFNTCHGAGEKSGDIRDAILKDGGASLFAGWSLISPVLDGNRTAVYVFSRLLGGNIPTEYADIADLVETPPQRPFRYSELAEDMAAKKLGAWFSEKYGQLTTFQFFEGSGDFALLAPSIEYAEIDERKKRLTIHGIFGPDPQKLRIFMLNGQDDDAPGGVELKQSASGGSGTIICDNLPDNCAGYLVAAIDHGSAKMVQSNAVPITSWTGTITFSRSLPDDPGSEITRIDVTPFLRGDVHNSRKRPGEMPSPRVSNFQYVRDPAAAAKFKSSGTYTNADGTKFSWHGDGTIPLLDDTAEGAAAIWGWYQSSPPGPAHPRLFIDLVTPPAKTVFDMTDKNGTCVPNLPCAVTTGPLGLEVNGPGLFILDFLQDSVSWGDPSRESFSYDIPLPNGKPIEKQIVSEISRDKIMWGKLTWTTLKAKFFPDKDTMA